MASWTDHLEARRYRRRHSRVSHMRSASVMGEEGALAVEVLAMVVHDETVLRTELYLVSCSGVKITGGGS